MCGNLPTAGRHCSWFRRQVTRSLSWVSSGRAAFQKWTMWLPPPCQSTSSAVVLSKKCSTILKACDACATCVNLNGNAPSTGPFGGGRGARIRCGPGKSPGESLGLPQ
eukprot:5039208-Amphidinium_carterae.1